MGQAVARTLHAAGENACGFLGYQSMSPAGDALVSVRVGDRANFREGPPHALLLPVGSLRNWWSRG